jgi:hypothetical protein
MTIRDEMTMLNNAFFEELRVKKPDAEVRDGTMAPASGYTTDGAGDDSPTTRGHALEADEAAETPVKKPAITDDANAKTASGTADIANEILALVRSVQKTAAAPAAAPAAVPAKVADKVAAAPAPKQPVVTGEAKVAGDELNMELTTDVMAKIAALIIATEEGAKLAESVLQKAAGADMAQETLAFLAQQSELAEKQAAFEQGQLDAQALIDQSIYDSGVRAAQVKHANDMFFKLGQAAADASMSDLMGGDPAAMGGDPAAMGGAPEEDPAAMGGDPAAMGGEGGEEVTLEDLSEALGSLVSDGTIPPEAAQQILEEIAGGEAGGEGVSGPAGEDVGAGTGEAPMAGAEEVPMEDSGAPKEASATKAAALLDVIRQLRASRG